ncbi:hypothetical protein THASP1DRAFT_14638 [Thamnocephalis sphaerospora]|uniref:Uncharacterized protein n=1 Tax=Thamnocephalis sphaerospora TaxID=78915 RepID=A0A4V1IWY3_9FUNG|nr:hypothetical protein THASP1DRAFT_14638 [Thamnocephalis sphaerospora]|eukprot:RKP09159.1 hypothetical protein THASP1DRAFT_14638 [Thamnocephalis sphaerospora]
MSESLKELSAEYARLRSIHGAFSSGAGEERKWVPEVDAFDGKKHQVMQALQKALGKPGTPMQDIVEAMGKPDDLATAESSDQDAANTDQSAGVQMMPGPVIGSESGHDSTTQLPIYAIYFWRGKHDYLWFKSNSETEKVIGSGWHCTLE